MNGFKIHTLNTAPEEALPILQQAQARMGIIPNLYGVMAESPVTLKAYTVLSQWLEDSVFSPEERSLLWLIISRKNLCTYCVAAHSMLAEMAKAAGEHIRAIRDGQPIQDARLESLRSFTERMLETRGFVSEAEVQAFLNAGFSNRHTLEVVTFIAHKTISNYINHLAGTPIDEAFVAHEWTPECS